MKAFDFLMMLMTDEVYWRTRRRCHVCLGEYLVHIDSYRNGIWKLHHSCKDCGDVEISLHNSEGLIEYLEFQNPGLPPKQRR